MIMNSSINAQNVNLNSMTNPHAWFLKDLKNVPQNGLKVMTTFSCGGGSSLGYKLAGCDVIAANDIDPEMAYHYKLNLNPKHYFLCPIKDLLKKQLPKELYELDILDGSPPCFAADTPVLTKRGILPIEQVQVNDYVLTHTGKWQKVTDTMQRISPTVLVDRRIECTPDHRFYAREGTAKQSQVRKLSEPDWVESRNLQGKFVATPVNFPVENLPLPPDGFTYSDKFWYMVGRWLGAGWVRYEESEDKPDRIMARYEESEDKPDRIMARYVSEQLPCQNCELELSRPHHRYSNQWTSYCSEKCRKQYGRRNRKKPRADVIICCSHKESDYLQQKLESIGCHVGSHHQKTVNRKVICGKSLVLWLTSFFGRYAKHKTMPSFVFGMQNEWREALLLGYCEADGHKEENGSWRISTIGRNLLMGVNLLAHSLGFTTTTIPRISQNNIIEGRDCNVNLSWMMSITEDDGRYTEVVDGLRWRKMRRNVLPCSELTTVYDLTVENDHSFIADGYVVHNCSTFSMAGSREKAWGKDKHFREGQAKQVLDDLFFDWLDLVEHLKPKVAIAENVKGMLQGNAKGYCKLIMERFKTIGYSAQLFLINAADCGVPQKRERVFFVALRSDIIKPKLILTFKNRWVNASDATSDLQILTDDEIRNTRPTKEGLTYWSKTRLGDSFSQTKQRLKEKPSSFSRIRLNGFEPASTLTGGGDSDLYHWEKCRNLSYREWKRLGSFPDDYQAKTDKIGKYMIGMSVPPKMMQKVAEAVIEQWLSDYITINL